MKKPKPAIKPAWETWVISYGFSGGTALTKRELLADGFNLQRRGDRAVKVKISEAK